MIFDAHGNTLTPGDSRFDEQPLSKGIPTVASRAATAGTWPFAFGNQPQAFGRLSFSLLRDIYEMSSSVRPIVDGLAREVAYLPWKVICKDRKYHDPKLTEDICKFLEMPNLDRDTLAIVLGKFLTDLLVIGKGVLLKVRDSNGTMRELIAKDAALIAPKYDTFGILYGYQEFERGSITPLLLHPIEDVVYRNFTPNTYRPSSTPIIETCINEISLLMLSVKTIGWTFTNDEIPPGILAIGKIATESLERARASFEANRGIDKSSNQIKVIDNVEGEVKWIQLTRPFRELQVAELIPIIEKIVVKNFGVSSVESGLADAAQGTARIAVSASQSKLVGPLMELTSEALTLEVISEIDPACEFLYSKVPQQDFAAQTQAWIQLWRSGLASRNRALLALGQDPVEGGDIFTVLLGNEVVTLDPITGEPQYRNPTGTPPADQPGNRNPGNQPVTPAADLTQKADDAITFDLDPNLFEEVFDVDNDGILEHAERKRKRRSTRNPY